MEEDYIEPSQPSSENELEDSLIRVSGMYKDWFLDYASYVILERAVPSIEDGFKPVQRRILHSMKDACTIVEESKSSSMGRSALALLSSDAFGMLSPNTVSEVSSIPNRQSQDDMIPKPFPLDGEGLEIMYVPPDLVCFGCTDARDRASGYGIRA